jgi:hypothetical protein
MAIEVSQKRPGGTKDGVKADIVVYHYRYGQFGTKNSRRDSKMKAKALRLWMSRQDEVP